jgi:hypothetical protein
MPSGDNTAEQDRVRELQVKLYLAAKRSPGRRFHALWDRIHRRDVLQRAWQQVRTNRGSAGVDRITITEIEEQGVEVFLDGLQLELRAALPPRPGAAGVHPQARALRAAAAGHPIGERPGVPDGGQARAGADLRGRLPRLLVRVPTQAVSPPGA